ncbi:MAG: TIGR04282 family arsenosugar biosynthesis glycosyltransferase [Deltaproteobacteria bacterium]|nr:TIGR04282 family arsenosugar biosynthesis glycosyltransferase [Deltaproteobacteria bacterium]
MVLFAKAPRAGRVKTRIAARLGDDFAVALARACLLDSWAPLGDLGDALLAWDGDAADVPFSAPIIPQGEGDLGARLERVLRHALSTAPWAIAIGSDSPGLPRHLLISAIDALSTHEAVIGPADDGGFYLLGLREVPARAFDQVPWSTDRACAATATALRARGLRVAELPRWFDVDVVEDLDRLRDAIRARRVAAPNVARVLGVQP